MSFDLDEDILQDFLIEAGEILERLSEQLVDLELSPNNTELLNAIFRGFHTIKGGAGFLSFTPLVDICHNAENIFDLLRTHQRVVSSDLMDIILEALDTINLMFLQVKSRDVLTDVPESLLSRLQQLSLPVAHIDEVIKPRAELMSEDISSKQDIVTSAIEGSNIDDITQAEFDLLLDELHGTRLAPETKASILMQSGDNHCSDMISDNEFEALLDSLHGTGGGPTKSIPSPLDEFSDSSREIPKTINEDINDDEFERLLDELHGIGCGPSLSTSEQDDSNVKSPVEVIQHQHLVDNDCSENVKNVAPHNVAQATSKIDSKIEPQKPLGKVQSESSVRVDTATLDHIMNMVGELVLARNRLVSLSAINNSDESLVKAISNLDIVTADLQTAVMKTRMQPIKKVFGRFSRVVRDLARSLQKDIVLEMSGEETDLDKNLVEALADPLVHLVRNSVDHGIESPEVRTQNGKSQTGTILLSAAQEGDHILLSIKDDGQGMDPQRLREIAIERGVLDADSAVRMPDEETYNLIFSPGFSTKSEISDISGRGVGMDVVKTAINHLNGSINIYSQLGEGTVIEIKVPLTLAILPTLMIGVNDQPFALPLACVNEIFHLDLRQTHTIDGQLTVVIRDKAIPLFYLQDWFSSSQILPEKKDFNHVVIIQVGHLRVGFVVDSLIGQEEVVIKPLDALLQGTPGISGATITSDGHIALILDVPNLLTHYA